MTLTASDVASLESALRCWEWAEYISTGVVFIGCVGEFFAEFTPFPSGEKRKHKLARLSLILVIAGIAGELLATVRTSQLSGLVIASVGVQAGDAKTSADNAADAAARADGSAHKADVEARQSSASAQRAKGIAEVAEKQAHRSESELAMLKAPRTISPLAQERMVDVLKAFKGTQFDLDVASSEEPVKLALKLRSILTQAGWKQVGYIESVMILKGTEPQIGVGDNNDGILVRINPKQETACSFPATLLMGLLREDGLATRGVIFTGDKSMDTRPVVHVEIGMKPLK